jgi:hypothetical protein
MAGFVFRETMSGNYYLLERPTEDKALSFTIAAHVESLRRFVRDKTARIEGEVTMEGIGERRPLSGTLGLLLFQEQRLPYEFTFRGDDGKRYTFRGEKDVLIATLPDSITTLPASVFDEDGKEIARAVVRFDLKGDLVKLIKSFRLKPPSLRSLLARG